MPDWAEILSRDGPAAWRSAHRLLGNRADADECFQDACVDAVAVARKGEVRYWRALLVRLATARAVDRLRWRGRDKSSGLGDWSSVPGAVLDPTQSALDAELAERLRRALATLPGPQAEAFCLASLEGWPHAEVALQMGITANAVGVLVHRARHRLAPMFDPAPAGSPRAVEEAR